MTWTESDSRLYQELAAVAVPDRAEQMAALLTLLPFGLHDAARVVELACGEGRLSHALLEAFPNATLLALDGSPDMLAQTSARLRPLEQRVEVAPFDLASNDWWPRVKGADAVVSSLAIHHLDGVRKQQLFAGVGRNLSPRGALLIADLIEPARPEARELFAAGWDQAAERQAAQPGGSTRALDQFRATGWNIFRYRDPMDMPSPLFEQLAWLRMARFAVTDCFWLRAGHAIYGGYKAATRTGVSEPLTFAMALAAAERALHLD